MRVKAGLGDASAAALSMEVLDALSNTGQPRFKKRYIALSGVVVIALVVAAYMYGAVSAQYNEANGHRAGVDSVEADPTARWHHNKPAGEAKKPAGKKVPPKKAGDKKKETKPAAGSAAGAGAAAAPAEPVAEPPAPEQEPAGVPPPPPPPPPPAPEPIIPPQPEEQAVAAAGAPAPPVVAFSAPLPAEVDRRFLSHAAWAPSLAGPVFCDAASCTGETKVISISLYGSSPRYTAGAIRNSEIVRDAFPDWQLWVYVPVADKDPDLRVPDEVLSTLTTNGARLITVSQATIDEIGFGMNQRFLPAEDPSVDRFEVRDGDSRLLLRERWTFDEWEESGAAFHIVRDHPSHSNFYMSGGLWGALKGALPDIRQLLATRKGSEYMDDMNFLNDVVWPIVEKKGMIQHDEFSCYRVGAGAKGYPYRRAGAEHVGGVYDAHDIVRAGDVQLLQFAPVPPQCAAPVYEPDARLHVTFKGVLACGGQHAVGGAAVAAAAASAATSREGYTVGPAPETVAARGVAQGVQRMASGGGAAVKPEEVRSLLVATQAVDGPVGQTLAPDASLAPGETVACGLPDNERAALYKDIEVAGVLTALLSPDAANSAETADQAAAGDAKLGRGGPYAGADPPGTPAGRLFAGFAGDNAVASLPLVTHIQWHKVFVDHLVPNDPATCPMVGAAPPPPVFDYQRVWEFAPGTYPSACAELRTGAYQSVVQYHQRVNGPITHYSALGPHGITYAPHLLYIQAAYTEDPAFFIAYALPHLLWFVARGPANPFAKVLLPPTPVVQAVLHALWEEEVPRVHALRPFPHDSLAGANGAAPEAPPLPSTWSAAHWVRVHEGAPNMYWAHRLHGIMLGEAIPWPVTSPEATGSSGAVGGGADPTWLLGDTCRRMGCGVWQWGLAPSTFVPGASQGKLAGPAANCIATAAAVSAHMKVAATAWYGGQGEERTAGSSVVSDPATDRAFAVFQLPPDMRRDHPWAKAVLRAIQGLGWRVRVIGACDYCSTEGLGTAAHEWAAPDAASASTRAYKRPADALATAVDAYRRATTVFMASNQISPFMQLMRPGARVVGLELAAPGGSAAERPHLHPVWSFVADACDALKLRCAGVRIPAPGGKSFESDYELNMHAKDIKDALGQGYKTSGEGADSHHDEKDGW